MLRVRFDTQKATALPHCKLQPRHPLTAMSPPDSEEAVSGSISIDKESVRERWQASGQFWLELRTESDDFRAFSSALGEVNQRFEPVDGPFTQLGTRSPDGFVTLVEGIADDGHLDQWLGALAEHFVHRGLEGTIRGVISERGPAWFDTAEFHDQTMTHHAPEPTAFIAWSIEHEPLAALRRSWFVPSSATDRICQHVAAWVEAGGPDVLVSRDQFSFTARDPDSVAPSLASAARAGATAGVLRYLPGRAQGRAAEMWPPGEATLQWIGADQPWRRRITDLHDAITALPELTTAAFIRPAPRCPNEWASSLGRSQPLPNGVDEQIFRTDDYFHDAHVPDAHGIQVLRDEHLANAHDLSAWNVTALGSGRHLVEAPDLAPWYSTPLPDPEVVERARRDFGAMILTQAIIDDLRSA